MTQDKSIIAVWEESTDAHIGLLFLNVWPVCGVKGLVNSISPLVVTTDATLLVLLGSQIVSIICVTFALLHHNLDWKHCSLILHCSYDRRTVTRIWSSIKRAFAIVLHKASCRSIQASVCLVFILDIEVKLTLVFLVLRITGKRHFDRLVFESHLFEASASSLVVWDWIGKSTFAGHTVLFEVLLSWFFGARRTPAKNIPVCLCVDRHASFLASYLLNLTVVPAVLMDFAFEVVITLFVFTSERGAGCLVWPIYAFSTVETNITVIWGVTIAIFGVSKATSFYLAVIRHAIITVHTVPPWSKILSQSRNFLAGSIQLLVLVLTLVRVYYV